MGKGGKGWGRRDFLRIKRTLGKKNNKRKRCHSNEKINNDFPSHLKTTVSALSKFVYEENKH